MQSPSIVKHLFPFQILLFDFSSNLSFSDLDLLNPWSYVIMQWVNRTCCRFENKTLIFPLTSHSIDRKARVEDGLGSRRDTRSSYPITLGVLDPGAEHNSESKLWNCNTLLWAVKSKQKENHQTLQGHSYYLSIRQITGEWKLKAMQLVSVQTLM